MDEQCCESRKIDKYIYKYACLKTKIKSFFHMIFWRILHLTNLARPYSVFACKHNFYSKIELTKVCHWCGKVH